MHGIATWTALTFDLCYPGYSQRPQGHHGGKRASGIQRLGDEVGAGEGSRRALFVVEHMATFLSTRCILYASLFICLAVDCSGRVKEILSFQKRSVDPKCLRWRHVELFAFPSVDGRNTLKAEVRYNDLESRAGVSTSIPQNVFFASTL